MELSLSTFLIVCPLVFIGSLLDAIGGGGALITLPAYLMCGVPVHNAIATNKLSSITGLTISSWRLCKNKCVDYRLAAVAVPASLLGASFGAKLSLAVSDKALIMLLFIILPVIAYYVFWNKTLGSEEAAEEIPWNKQSAIMAASALVVGCYDGFYGPGTGTFLLLAFTVFAKMDVRKASGTVKLVNIGSNLSSIIVFLINGKVFIILGLAASVFSMLGQYIGSGIVIRNGTKAVRPVILIMLAIFYIKLIIDYFL